MINLLPLQEKENLRKEENWKIIAILGILVFSFLICFSLILFLINIYVSAEVNVQRINYQLKEKEFLDSQLQPVEEKIVAANKTLGDLYSFYQNQTSQIGIFEKISQLLPAGVYLTNLSLVNQPKEIIINLNGFSPTRDLLREFKEKLEGGGSFSEINFPPSNWLEQKDIKFSVSFKINLTSK